MIKRKKEKALKKPPFIYTYRKLKIESDIPLTEEQIDFIKTQVTYVIYYHVYGCEYQLLRRIAIMLEEPICDIKYFYGKLKNKVIIVKKEPE